MLCLYNIDYKILYFKPKNALMIHKSIGILQKSADFIKQFNVTTINFHSINTQLTASALKVSFGMIQLYTS